METQPFVACVPVIALEARVWVSSQGFTGELAERVRFDAPDHALRVQVAAALRDGLVPGVPARDVRPRDLVVDRSPASGIRAFHLIRVRG